MAADQSCSINVTFAPTAAGVRNGSLNVFLGVSAVAGASVNGLVAITNVSTAASPVTIAITGAVFSQTNDCPASLPANASCVVTVKFAPLASTVYTGSLTANGARGTQSVALSGTGTAVALTVTPSSIDFGYVQWATNSAAQSQLRTRPPFHVGITRIQGTGSSFHLTTNCKSTLAAGKFAWLRLSSTQTTRSHIPAL